jgi:FtsP/CotA-like multicopper oxidase with cupredoxin domain
MHLHLVQFQVLKRIPFDDAAYKTDWLTLNGWDGVKDISEFLPFPNGYTPKSLSVANYINGPEELAPANEQGWKDTVKSPSGYLTVVCVRFAPQSAPVSGSKSPKPGVNLFSFDPTVGPGYVWHCHIVDHEDNEMMRPYIVTK